MITRVLKTVLVAAILTVSFLTLAPQGQTRFLMEHDHLARANFLPVARIGLVIDASNGVVETLPEYGTKESTGPGLVRQAFAQEEPIAPQLKVINLVLPPEGSTPAGGIFPITITLENIGAEPFHDIFFRVEVLEYTDGGDPPPELVNADRGGTGVGADKVVTLPGGVLPPGGTFNITFDILLPEIKRFNFFVNAFTAEGGLTLPGGPDFPALDATIDLPPKPSPSNEIENGLIMTKLDVVLSPEATVGEVNAALGLVFGRIVYMRPGSPDITVSIPHPG